MRRVVFGASCPVSRNGLIRFGLIFVFLHDNCATNSLDLLLVILKERRFLITTGSLQNGNGFVLTSLFVLRSDNEALYAKTPVGIVYFSTSINFLKYLSIFSQYKL